MDWVSLKLYHILRNVLLEIKLEPKVKLATTMIIKKYLGT
jgi:hypothetical protein